MTTQRRKYEAMFVLNNAHATAETGQGVGIVTDLLKKHGADVKHVGVWDERKLAYPIQGQKRGTYVLAHIEAAPETVQAINHEVNIAENVMRALVSSVGEEFPEFRTYAEMEALRPKRDPAEPKRRRDDDHEDDDSGERGDDES